MSIPPYNNVINVINDINDSLANLQSQINSLTVLDYTSDLNGINSISDSITNLQSQIDNITVPDYTTDINSLNDLISDVQSHIDTLTSDNNNNINEINEINGIKEKLSTRHTNCMELKGQLVTAFDNINSIKEQLKSLVIPSDSTSEISRISDSIAGLFTRLSTLDVVNSAAHSQI
jgi:chromosome segregation ATPase